VTAKIFRSHDRVPSVPESGLYRQLLTEWVDLNTTTGPRNAVTRWGRLEPALAGHTRPADIVDAIDKAERGGKDAILGALIKLFHDGHQLAGRIALQVMLPKLSALAKHSDHGPDNVWTEDRRHNAIACFWEMLTDYPISRRPNSVAAGLGLETLRLITTPRNRPIAVEIPAGDRTLEYIENNDGRETGHQVIGDPGTSGTIDTDATLDTVVAWGVKRGVIKPVDGTLLLDAYSPTRRDCDFDGAAARAGIKREAARKRCTRARERLTIAIHAELNPEAATQSA